MRVSPNWKCVKNVIKGVIKMREFLRILTFLFLLKEIPEIVFKGKELPSAVFSHRTHAGIKNITCEVCHSNYLKPYENLAKEKNLSLREVIDKKFCEFCHTGKVAFSTKEDKNCRRCHNAKK
jgi:c(7)-type cytochrome triheme protein